MLQPPNYRSMARWLAATGLLTALLAPASRAQQQAGPAKPEAAPKRPAMRDAITEQALRKEVKGAAKLDSLMKAFALPAGEARPSTESSLISSSIILFDGEKFTLVPMGSILHLPEAHRSRVIGEPQGDFTVWPNFLKRNGAWLAAKEVPLAMAKGDGKTAEILLREVSTDRRVLVSVYKGGPIMILEPAPADSGGEVPAAGPEVEGEKHAGRR